MFFMKKFLCVLMAVCLLALCISACSRSDNNGEADVTDTVVTDANGDPVEGQDAYDEEDDFVTDFTDLHTFSADTRDGGHFGPEDFAKYDVTIINCWATFCGPCIGEMPDIAEYQKSLPENVQLITYCLDGSDCFDDMKKILDDAGYTGITLVNGDGDLQTLGSQIMYVPTTLFVDSKGNVCGQPIVGAAENVAEAYNAAVDSIINQ